MLHSQEADGQAVPEEFYSKAAAGDYRAVGGFNAVAIWAAIYRSRYWAAGIVVAMLLAGIVVTLMTTPIYEARTTVQADQDNERILASESQDTVASVMDAKRFLQTQLDILRSESLSNLVAEELNLYRNSDKFFQSMNEDLDIETSTFLSKEDATRERVLELLDKNLEVRLPAESRIITISFRSPDAAFASRVANSYANNFIRNNLQRKFDSSSYAREFLRQQLDEARGRLEISERQQLAYARRTRLIDTSNAAEVSGVRLAPKSLTAATLVQLNQSHATAVADRLKAQKKWEVASRGSIKNVTEVLQNETIQRLLQGKALLQAQMQEQRERRKEDYPVVRQLQAQLDEFDGQINSIANNIRQSLRQDYNSALAVEQGIAAQIATLKDKTLEEQSLAVQLGILDRTTQTDRELYDLLLKRYNELNAEAGMKANNILLVDKARTPSEPVAPNIPVNMILSFIAGLGLAALFIFGREQLFDTLRTPDQVRERLDLPVIGVVPEVKNGAEDTDLLRNPKSEVSEAFSSLRAALMLASSHGLPKSIQFTSTRASEGKSFTTIATGIGLARIGKRVVVLDVDLRRPNQHRLNKLDNKHGTSDLLTHNMTIDEVLRREVYPGVDMITGGPIPPNPTELLTSESLSELVRQLEDRYDVVLLDSAPLLGLADAVLLGGASEATVLVIYSAGNQTATVRNAVARLRTGGAKVIGAVLNRFDAKQAGYAYEYSYSYESEHEPA